jgi:hypothetical protein
MIASLLGTSAAQLKRRPVSRTWNVRDHQLELDSRRISNGFAKPWRIDN